MNSVDVLAVLDDAANKIESEWWPEAAQPVREARAAVAELVEAVSNTAENMGWDESHPVVAALARVKGDAA